MKNRMVRLYVKAQILREEHGQDMAEYALVVGITALGATAAMGVVATAISNMFTTLGTAVDNASKSGGDPSRQQRRDAWVPVVREAIEDAPRREYSGGRG